MEGDQIIIHLDAGAPSEDISPILQSAVDEGLVTEKTFIACKNE